MSDAALSDLLFSPVTELAQLVRSGEVSARELVQTSLERIEEHNPQLNAFVEVDGERALAAADAVSPRRRAAVRGVPIAIKNNRAVSGLKLTYGCPLMSEYVADYDHNVTRRLRDAGFIVVGTTTLPEYGILPVSEARCSGPPATRGTWSARPAAPRAAPPPRWPRAWCRSRTATTAAARCGSRRPAAASSGSRRSAGASRSPPSWATSRSWSTASSRAPWPKPPRCSTCWPATSWATPPGRRRRRSRSRSPPGASRDRCG